MIGGIKGKGAVEIVMSLPLPALGERSTKPRAKPAFLWARVE